MGLGLNEAGAINGAVANFGAKIGAGANIGAENVVEVHFGVGNVAYSETGLNVRVETCY